MLWPDKYAPKSLKEVKGNDLAISKLKDFIINFKKKKKKSVVLVGPTGTGKTCCIYAFAKEEGYEVLELNASDERNKGKVEEFMDKVLNQQSLSMKPKMVLIEEIDGLSGSKDRGGAQSLSKIIERTNFPIIMTANDISLEKLSFLIKKAEIIEFKELNFNEIVERLNEISREEGLEADDFTLKSIASRSGGDLRAAIIDLQTLAVGQHLEKESLELIGDRKREQELNNILRLIFKSKNINLIDKNVEDVDLDDLCAWLSENVVLEYDIGGIRKAFDFLSKSDIFKGRIIRWQYWRFLVYQKLLISSVALAKERKSDKIIDYKRPKKGLYIWQANMKNIKKKSISLKLAKYCKVSNKKAFKDVFPQVSYLIKDPKIQESLELSDEEVGWIENKLC
jgi:replication factor C large subunit